MTAAGRGASLGRGAGLGAPAAMTVASLGAGFSSLLLFWSDAVK
jgi:hypothetical protein